MPRVMPRMRWLWRVFGALSLWRRFSLWTLAAAAGGVSLLMWWLQAEKLRECRRQIIRDIGGAATSKVAAAYRARNGRACTALSAVAVVVHRCWHRLPLFCRQMWKDLGFRMVRSQATLPDTDTSEQRPHGAAAGESGDEERQSSNEGDPGLLGRSAYSSWLTWRHVPCSSITVILVHHLSGGVNRGAICVPGKIQAARI